MSARDQLLAAAKTLFCDEGIQRLGIDKVIETAGVAKASLSNTFGGKSELIGAYIGWPPRSTARPWSGADVALRGALAAALSAAGLVVGMAAPAVSAPVVQGSATVPIASPWSAGYRLDTPGHKLLHATWTVPDAHCSSTASGMRVMLSLTHGPSSVRVGVASTCTSGSQHDRPFVSVDGTRGALGRAVQAGDVITASVEDSHTSFELMLTDHTAGWGVGFDGDGTGGQTRNIASVLVAEIGQGPLAEPLAQFSTVAFTACTVDGRPMSRLHPRRVQLHDADGGLAATTSRWVRPGMFTVTRIG